MKEPKKPELDLNVMQSLYEFGGLYVYRACIFDELKKQNVVIRDTFSEEAAKLLLCRLPFPDGRDADRIDHPFHGDTHE